MPTTYQDLARIRYVTGRFRQMQGLRLLPWGVFLMLGAGKMLGWYPPGMEAHFGSVELAAFVICVGLHLWIHAYYRRAFGRVDAEPAAPWKEGLLVLLVLAAAVADGVLTPPVSLFGLALACMFFAAYAEWRERVHCLVVGLFLVSASLVPLWFPAASGDPVWGSSGVLFFLFGAGMVVGAIFDHRLLLRVLPPLPTDAAEVPHA